MNPINQDILSFLNYMITLTSQVNTMANQGETNYLEFWTLIIEYHFLNTHNKNYSYISDIIFNETFTKKKYFVNFMLFLFV